MLGTRTKQVFAYGRRGQRIINISERRDRDQPIEDPCEDPSIGVPIRKKVQRENAIVLSPTRARVQRNSKRSSIHDTSTITPTKTKAIGAMKKKHPLNKLHTPDRQPLTPVRMNCISSSPMPRKPVKKAKPTGTKAGPRLSLKPHSPIVEVDIILMDEAGRTVSEERRLSHPDVQANFTYPPQGRYHSGKQRTTQPIVITNVNASPPPKSSQTRQNPDASAVTSSDESKVSSEFGVAIRGTQLLGHENSGSLRVEVIVPPAPYRISRVPTGSSSIPFIVPDKTPCSPIQRPTHIALPTLIPPPLTAANVRQLTPIRRGPSRAIFQRSYSTPSTPTEVDLSLELAQLDISHLAESEDLCFPQPAYLLPLLNECSQTCPYEFSAFIETFPFDPIVQATDADVEFRKIGEASFSEVFGIGDVVLKVIPIRNEEEPTYQDEVEMPAPSDARDVLKEMIVTREIGELCDGFVTLLKTYVVRGKYPTLFLQLWDEYNERKGSESVRPDSFGLNQVYAIIVLPNGGPDLESFTFKHPSKSGWQQACGIFWQVARALEQVEDLVHFEHRDLHWGQILVKNVPVGRSHTKCTKFPMDDTQFGVKATIIDLGLSRMDAADSEGGKTYWTPFDEDIFEGEGDYQYNVYRMMRDLNGGAWDRYQPFTNVMWLHYLVTKLLHWKRLKPPGTRKKTNRGAEGVSPTGYDEQECYNCLVEMERLLGSCISARLKVQKGHRKTVAPSVGPLSARDVVVYGVQRGWMQ